MSEEKTETTVPSKVEQLLKTAQEKSATENAAVVEAAKDSDNPKSVSIFAYGSPQHRRMIQTAFKMTFEFAQEVLDNRPKNPALYPYEVWEKAKKMFSALNPPVPTASQAHWERVEYGD